MAKNLEIYMSESSSQIERLGKMICSEDIIVQKIQLNNFVYELFSKFILSINRITTGITSHLPSNRAEIIATDLCISRNKNVKDITADQIRSFCMNYYRTGDHKYALQSIELSIETDAQKTPSVIFRIFVKLPSFEYFKNSVHSILSIPQPLYRQEIFYLFKVYFDMPKSYVFLHEFDNRRLAIDDCQNTNGYWYCPYKKLSNIYSLPNLCINALFTNQTDNCSFKIVTSITNCLIEHTSDYLMICLNQLFNQNKQVLNVHRFGGSEQTVKFTNITLLHGMKNNIKVQCEHSYFDYFVKKNYVRNIIVIADYSNISSSFPTVSSMFHIVNSLVLNNSKNVTNILHQLKYSQDQTISDFHKNLEKLDHIKIPFVSKTASDAIYKFSMPILIIVNLLFMLFFA